MLMLRFCVAFWPPVKVAVIPMPVKLPTVVGVPLMTPVAVLSESPGGIVPAVWL
jgi:hypothetical protein